MSVATAPRMGLATKWQGGGGRQEVVTFHLSGSNVVIWAMVDGVMDPLRFPMRSAIWGNYYALPPMRCWLIQGKAARHYGPPASAN